MIASFHFTPVAGYGITFKAASWGILGTVTENHTTEKKKERMFHRKDYILTGREKRRTSDCWKKSYKTAPFSNFWKQRL